MLGRIQEWLTKTDFKIIGGRSNFGIRENDVAIIDLIKEPKDMKMLIEGCKISKLYWKSQCLTDDDCTWVNDLQHLGKFNVGNFVWQNIRENQDGTRTQVRHENKWSTWTLKVKVLLAKWRREAVESHKNPNSGKFFDGDLPVLTPLTVVLTKEMSNPWIVIEQTGDKFC